MTTTVSEILRQRPWLGVVLALPRGYRVVMDFRRIESVETEAGEQVWCDDPALLARFARSALMEMRLSDLERMVNGLLDTITPEVESRRGVRSLARRWGGGPWVAYANALTALAFLKQDEAATAEVRALVDELRSALSPRGSLAGEVAPFAITESITTLYRGYLRDQATAVLDGLLTLDSGQQAALLFQRAALRVDANDSAGAIEALRRSVAVEPRAATTWFLLGSVLYHHLRFDEVPIFTARLSDVVDSFDRALALLDTQDTLDVDRCVRALDHLRLRADSLLSELLLRRTNVLCDLGRLDEALASADRLIAAAPDDLGSWRTRGTVLGALGRYVDAIDAFTEAIRRSAVTPAEHPMLGLDLESLLYNRAAAHALLGHRSESIADLRRAIASAPECADMVSSDERFQGLISDAEVQRLIEEGRSAARAREEV